MTMLFLYLNNKYLIEIKNFFVTLDSITVCNHTLDRFPLTGYRDSERSLQYTNCRVWNSIMKIHLQV